MAGKISTLILTVDLDCRDCYKKIWEIILKLQDRKQIQTFSFETKNNTVTVSGVFDPQKLKEKLLCETPKHVIKEIMIKEDDKKPPLLTETKPVESEKPKPTPPEKPKDPKKLNEPEKPKPPEPEKEMPNPPPTEPVNDKPKPLEPNQGNRPVWPAGPSVPCCCWRPCYERYYGGCRCCCCGKFYG